MKALTTIGKNLRLLFRSKESAYTIIVGPLLIILLVSFAFMGAEDDYTVRLGTYSPAPTSFSTSTIAALSSKDYIVSVYPDQDSCVEGVKTGAVHACMVFSGREAGNGTIPVTFYLDMSRTNIIYQISDDLEGELDVQADAISSALAGDALTRMSTAATLVDKATERTDAIAARLDDVNTQLLAAKASLANISNDTVNVSLQDLRSHQLGLAQNARIAADDGIKAIDTALDAISDLQRACDECEPELKTRIDKTADDLEATQHSLQLLKEEKTQKLLFESNLLLQYAVEDLAALNKSITADTAARAAIAQHVTDASRQSETNLRDIKQVSASLRYTSGLLRGSTLQAQDITTPVSTSIVSVTATDDRLSFAYPYLLVLVIMFMGMLLASILIVTDKTSRARFRSFTTPTSDGYHIIMSFITASLIMCTQVAVILALSSVFVAQPLFLNPLMTLLIIGIAIVLFTFIGMIIGYLASTQEAAMIASISVGSVLLFVSNLIVPIEGMGMIAQYLTRFNPYLVLSELLKRSMLYGVSVAQVSRELLALLVLAVVLLLITLFIQRRARRAYFRQDGGLLAPHVPAPLILGEVKVNTPVELLDALDRMTRSEFERIVTSDENAISQWARNELRDRRLARRLRTRSKERMMLALDKHIKAHSAKMKR